MLKELHWSSEDGIVVVVKVYSDGKREKENTGVPTCNPQAFMRLKRSMEARLAA